MRQEGAWAIIVAPGRMGAGNNKGQSKGVILVHPLVWSLYPDYLGMNPTVLIG